MKYPLMQLEDILKLHLQGILGPTHLIKDIDRLKNNLINEYNECKDNKITYDLIEQISDEYVRVYIKPYYEKYQSFDKLIDLFVKSCNVNYDINEYIKEIKKLINKDNEVLINEYLNNKNYVISHSSIYKENYKPHYLVIKSMYKEEL
jgi:hypothetical protein